MCDGQCREVIMAIDVSEPLVMMRLSFMVATSKGFFFKATKDERSFDV